MVESLNKWKIFQELSDELKRNIRLAVVHNDGAIYVTKDDEFFTFDQNKGGLLDTDKDKPRTEHTKIEKLCGQNIQGLQFSENSFFAISGSGSVYACGDNFQGQLGLGTKQRTFIPTKIEGILGTKRVVQLTCSFWHTLALTSDREIFSFGCNKYGQLGLGPNEDQSLPVKLDFPVAGRIVTAIACLLLSSVALLDSGEVLTWGANHHGVLGHSDDDSEEHKIPRKVLGLEGIKIRRIVCGTNHVLALSKDGKVYSWGWNKFGQLGNGTNENSNRPTLISGIVGRVKDVAAHFQSIVSAAVTEADEVYVWGGFNGQDIMSPKKTAFTSLDEVFANNQNRALTFRALRPKVTEPIEEKNTETELPEWLKNSFDDADTADVVFVVEGKKVHAHKAILIMRCVFFRTMFQGDWIESNQREQIIVNYSYDAFFAFLKYFYTNEVDPQPDLALELFSLAHFYHMTDLQKECVKIIKRGVSVENAAVIYEKAIQLASEEIKEFVFNFCVENLNAVLNSDGFKLLQSEVVKEFVLRAAQQGVFKNI